MATTNSTLLTNLQSIYNTKLQIKAAIPTNSDIFSDYPGYITALKPSGYAYITSNGDHNIAAYEMVNVDIEGGEIPAGYTYVSGTKYISVNGTFDVAAYENAYVHIAGAYFINSNGTFDVADYSDAIVNVPPPAGYTYVSGTYNITESGEYDVTSYSTAYVDIESGGSGEVVDPWYNYSSVQAMIENEETTADYVSTNLDENFTVTLDQNEENIEAIEWDFSTEVPTGELDQDDNQILESKKFHVIVNGDPHEQFSEAQFIALSLEDYPDLYGFIYPTLENATLTESEDPSEDGYDYLLEGDLYAWNLNDDFGGVEEVTENGFYATDGRLGFNVNVEIPSDYIVEANNIDLLTGYENYIDTSEPLPVLLACDVVSDYSYSAGEAVYATQLSFDGHTYTAQVTVSDLYEDPYSSLYDENDELYSDLYGYLRMVVGNAVIEEDLSGNYDYTITADFMNYSNLQTQVNEFSEINSNGYYNTIPYAYTYINVSGGGGGITPSGTSYITTNGNHDVSSYAYAYVTVSGGSGSSEDPMYDALTMAEIIEDGLTSAKYLRIPIDDNFDYRGLQNAPYAMWEANIRYYDENLNDNVDALVIVSIMSDNHNVLYDEGLRLNSAFTSYPELYGDVQPVLEDVTVEFVQKPSGDYYSVTGGIHYVCTPVSTAEVRTITQNGVYPTGEGIGVNIAVPQGAIVPAAGIGSLDDIAADPTNPMAVIVSAESTDWIDTGDFENDNLIQNSEFYNYIENMSDNSFICQLNDTDSDNNKYFILADSYGSGTPSWYIVEMTECGIVYDSRFNSYAYILNGPVTDFDNI